MLIGELAKLTNTTPRALRYYEQQGLLDSTRTPSGYRTYAPAAQRRVRNIRDLLALGFTIENVRAFLPYLDLSLPESFIYDPQCPDGYAVGAARVAELNSRIATLTHLRDQLVVRMPWLSAFPTTSAQDPDSTPTPRHPLRPPADAP